jgi:glycosyltransferase EpsD
MKEIGWNVDVACAGDEPIPYCDHQFHMSYKRTPFSFGSITGINELKKIISEGHYDVVYCHTPVGGAVARIASRKARANGLKVIYMAHGFHFYKGAPILNWMLYYPIEKILSKDTDAIITINQEDYQNANTKLHCRNVYLLDGIGVDLSRFRAEKPQLLREEYRHNLSIPQDAIVMVYLAELIKNKNQKLLIDTLKQLRDAGQNCYLLLAGIDHNNGSDMQYADEIGMKEYVRYLGWRSDIENLYAISDVCTASSIREGFGVNLAEAMASGLPVVATVNRGHSTIIQDGVNGYLVPLDNPKAMAKKIVLALKKKHNLIENYDLEKYESQAIVDGIIRIISTTFLN